MSRLEVRDPFETLDGGYINNLAETGLQLLASNRAGAMALRVIGGVQRFDDSRLETEVAGLKFENPVMVCSGSTKDARAVEGLLNLGFGGVEIGTVPVYPQAGDSHARLWFDQGVKKKRQPGVIGISLGKNKEVPDADAPGAYAEVARQLTNFADYFAINVGPPNTPGLRNIFDTISLTDIVQAVKEVTRDARIPIFIKTAYDLTDQSLDKVLGVGIENRVNGIIDSDTTTTTDMDELRFLCNERMKYITRATKDTGLQRIGVGGINDVWHAIDRLEHGAQVIQVRTGIRQRGPRIASMINEGLLRHMVARGMNLGELVGKRVV